MDPEALMAFIRENQAAKEFPAAQPIRRHFLKKQLLTLSKRAPLKWQSHGQKCLLV